MSEVSAAWKLYICRACGLIYDEKEGDPDSGLAPGTRFDDIPDDWECPLCGVKKSDFELFERPIIDNNAATFSAKNKAVPGIVIIGGGIAGWSMVEAIRQHNTQIPVTMITACAGDVYHKPELSVAIGRHMSDKGLVREKGSEAAQRLSINLLANTFVVGLSAKTKIVRTTRGSFDFTQLVLAQGAQSDFVKEIPAEWCWRINHLNNWSGLQQKLKDKAQRVAIIGGGMVGCELAENLSVAGHDVSLIYRHEIPLNNLLPSEAGLRFKHYLEQQGVHCIKNSTVKKASMSQSDRSSSNESEHTSYQLQLNTQDKIEVEYLEVDHIVTATGLKTDQRLPKMAGLAYQNGILVNSETLETSQKTIFALGDCISLSGQACRFIAPIFQQAKVIASQLLESDKQSYQHETPTIRLKTQACSLVLYGQPVEGAEWLTISEDEEHLNMEQWVEGHLVSTLALAKAS